MCNYFTRHREPRNLQAAFKFPELPNDPPRYVVRPTDTERVVAVGRDCRTAFGADAMGLGAVLGEGHQDGPHTYNWRSEEVASKPAFSGPWERGHRCLVPCDGFFEFTGPKGHKQPWLFKPKDDRVMAFAGLWDQWKGPKDAPKDTPLAPPLLSFSIATCEPNATVAPIHNRMPVLFTREAEWNAWLHPDAVKDELRKLLIPAPDDLLDAFPVSRDLLRTKEPGPELLTPISLGRVIDET